MSFTRRDDAGLRFVGVRSRTGSAGSAASSRFKAKCGANAQDL